MKPGDFVKDVYPNRRINERFGVILKQVHPDKFSLNKSFNVLWLDGTVGKNVWDYDLWLLKQNA